MGANAVSGTDVCPKGRTLYKGKGPYSLGEKCGGRGMGPGEELGIRDRRRSSVGEGSWKLESLLDGLLP